MLGGSDAGAHLDLMCHANYPTVVLGRGGPRSRACSSLEEAVEMMTDRPARHYGLPERGRVAEGWHADLVVFDPAAVASEPATLRRRPARRRRAALRRVAGRGPRAWWPGGEVVRDGVVTDERPGRVLRSGRDTETVTLAEPVVRPSRPRR